jgi:hypothetical protein
MAALRLSAMFRMDETRTFGLLLPITLLCLLWRRWLSKSLQCLHLIFDKRCNRRKCVSSHRVSQMNGSDRFAALIGGNLLKDLNEW